MSEPQDVPDTSEPDVERQGELRAAYQANVAAGKSPYERVKIRTLGELHWVIGERDWSMMWPDTTGEQRPNLTGANLENANLCGVHLPNAVLVRTNLEGANLSRAHLLRADLSEAILFRANLSGAYLAITNLTGAVLSQANLSMASLYQADLRGAHLFNANLTGTDLREAQLDAKAQLISAKLNIGTRLGDIDWQGVLLTRVDWPKRLGDERVIKVAKDRTQRIHAFRDAAQAYCNLSIALRSQWRLIPASNYRLREQMLERKAMLNEWKLLGWAFCWLLFLVAGYGERPARSFYAYLSVLVGFAALYWLVGPNDGHHFLPDGALVFSLTSFHGRGFSLEV